MNLTESIEVIFHLIGHINLFLFSFFISLNPDF
jgi:hypothetical protein